jgi:ubiquinone/menaquinone biosynthesis C-methylase UbiE/predicted sugar kinase
MKNKFPIIKVGYIFNPLKLNIESNLKLDSIEINYPCRLDAMAINPAAVVYNSDMIFTPGEVVISLKKFINVKIRVLSSEGGNLIISETTKRKVLVKHAYLLMCSALNVHPSLEIDVDDNNIPKHCGFGSSSSTISAVAAAINELYGCPIENNELIKYLASNHGEEISDNDKENLKVVQCIGGGATNGLTEEGVIIIAGKSTTIAKLKYEGEVLIGVPKDFVQKDAKVLMELEEQNLWKFKKTGDQYAEKIAYNLLHKALPDLVNGNIKELADIVYEYRFNMGSNENCSFVYDGLVELGNELRCLYENSECEFLALSSVGPAFFVIVKNSNQKENCIKKMRELNLNIIESSICNTTYLVNNKKYRKVFWQEEETAQSFSNKEPSKYITKILETFDLNNKNCIDIGCGGGRYTRYLMKRGANVLAIDKYPEMIGDVNSQKINFVNCNMDNIPVKDKSYDLVMSIGVIHNSVTLLEFINSIKEIYRVTNDNGNIILSLFTNDIITEDLILYGENLYRVKDRPPMVLLSKDQINKILEENNLKIIKFIDEHITDVGGGKRNVYTLLLQK